MLVTDPKKTDEPRVFAFPVVAKCIVTNTRNYANKYPTPPSPVIFALVLGIRQKRAEDTL